MSSSKLTTPNADVGRDPTHVRARGKYDEVWTHHLFYAFTCGSELAGFDSLSSSVAHGLYPITGHRVLLESLPAPASVELLKGFNGPDLAVEFDLRFSGDSTNFDLGKRNRVVAQVPPRDQARDYVSVDRRVQVRWGLRYPDVTIQLIDSGVPCRGFASDRFVMWDLTDSPDGCKPDRLTIEMPIKDPSGKPVQFIDAHDAFVWASKFYRDAVSKHATSFTDGHPRLNYHTLLVLKGLAPL